MAVGHQRKLESFPSFSGVNYFFVFKEGAARPPVPQDLLGGVFFHHLAPTIYLLVKLDSIFIHFPIYHPKTDMEPNNWYVWVHVFSFSDWDLFSGEQAVTFSGPRNFPQNDANTGCILKESSFPRPIMSLRVSMFVIRGINIQIFWQT